MRHRYVIAGIAGAVLVSLAGARTGPPHRRVPDEEPKGRAVQQLKAMPIAFEANRGQTATAASFVARGQGYAVWATADGPVLRLADPRGRDAGASLRLRVVNTAARQHPVPESPLPGRANYFIGNEPAQWQTNVPRYAALRYRAVYQGVDLVLHGTQQSLEYDFEVAPHADPSQIAVAFEGAQQLRVEPSGDLTLAMANGEIGFRPPVAYQERHGEREVIPARYEVGDDDVIRFALGEYDPTRPLVIDPVLSYSTYLGGTTSHTGGISAEGAYAVAVDADGNAYVAGFTNAIDFPTTIGSLDGTCGGCTNSGGDAWVAKIDPSQSGAASLVFTTYLGSSGTGSGTGSSVAYGVAVDGNGSVYVTGSTNAFDSLLQPGNESFPTTASAFQPNDPGDQAVLDAFLTKLDPTGSSLLYSTYIGGTNVDEGSAVAVDALGNAVVVGWSASTNFPALLNGFKMTNTSFLFDGFLAVFNTTSSGSASLTYGTLVGGGSSDRIGAVATDAFGRVYVTGSTQSGPPEPFPVLNGFQTVSLGGQDSFLTVIDPSLAGVDSLLYSTLISTNGTENGAIHDGGVAVDDEGHVYVIGTTFGGSSFPATPGALKSAVQSSDAYVVKIDPTAAGASSLVAATLIGGTFQEGGTAIAVDRLGNPVAAGWSTSSDLAVSNCSLPKHNGVDGFVMVLDPSLTGVKYSTPIGGSGTEHVYGLAIRPSGAADPPGALYVAGYTESTNFPTTVADSDTTTAAFEPAHRGGQDAFFAIISQPLNACLPPAADALDASTPEDTPVQLSLTATDAEGNNVPPDVLTWAVIAAPSHGTLDTIGGTMAHGGTTAYSAAVTYTPALNYFGPDSFAFRVSDGVSSSNAVVTLTVTPVNDAPVAATDLASTDDNTLITVSVLANDVDPDGDAVMLVSADTCQHGTATANADGTITYAPPPGFGGVDVCGYTVTDPHGAQASGQLVVTVTQVNDPPSLVDPGDQQTAEGTAVSLQLTASDPDGDALSFQAAGLPPGLSIDANGLVSGAPAAGSAGSYAVTVSVDDGFGGSANVAFTWVVTAPVSGNHPPLCAAAQPSVTTIWPADHRLVAIAILGVTDPDAEQPAITITRILQDEPTNTFGDGATWIDGFGVGTPVAHVRAERVGTPRVPGDGRVYAIFFTAADSQGATCSGSVIVSVPHDASRPAIAGGVQYDSTVPGGQPIAK